MVHVFLFMFKNFLLRILWSQNFISMLFTSVGIGRMILRISTNYY